MICFGRGIDFMLSALKGVKTLKKRAIEDPVKYFVPTRPQKDFIEDPSKIKMLLGGNQIGKSIATCYLLVTHCLQRHPTLKTDPPPIEAWLITHSHEQSRTLQQKLFDMIPKDTLSEDCEFVRGKGFRGAYSPVVRFKNGSIIRIKTANQGLGLASATANLICIDEPVPMDVFNECLARTIRSGSNQTRGTLTVSMTPVGGVDVDYLEQMMNSNKISVTVGKLCVEDTTPIGLQPLLSPNQIKSVVDSFLPVDREARVNGSFHVAPIGIVFTHFSDNMISHLPAPKGGEYKFAIGIDHGSTPSSQCAVLCAIDIKDEYKPKVYVLDEYSAGEATPELHVRAILNMLKKHDIPYNKVHWTGDGEHRGARGFKMSNLLLMRAFESVLNLPHKALPFYIREIKKRKHSVYFSASVLHSIMARGDFFVQPDCKQLISSIKNWTMKRTQDQRSRDRFGHMVDALRYAVLPIVNKKYQVSYSRLKVR